MNEITVRFRRRRYFLLRVADEPVLDIGRFFRGETRFHGEPRCWLLCPIRGESLPLTAAELALIMTLPVDDWLTVAELQSKDQETQALLLDLARRGVVLADPAPSGWDDLVAGEQIVEQTHWHELAAVYHAHSRWQGVVGNSGLQNYGEDADRVRFEELRRIRGDPPSHFFWRPDAQWRRPLRPSSVATNPP